MNRLYIYLAIIAFAITSCTETLDTSYKGDSDNFLVVVGEFSSDTTNHIVYLSRTVDYNADSADVEEDAIVTITDLSNSSVFSLTETSPGIYETENDVYGIEGHEYQLDIETSSGDSYYAISKMNPLTDIDSIKVSFEYLDILEFYFYKVYFYGQETVGEGDYYMWNLYLNDTLYNDTLSKTQFQPDDFVEGQYIIDFDLYWLEPKEVKGDTILFTVEMESITEEYYNYLVDVMSETAWRGGPFDATPANVSSNIQGEGAIGFFKTSLKKRKSVLHIKDDLEKEHADDVMSNGF